MSMLRPCTLIAGILWSLCMTVPAARGQEDGLWLSDFSAAKDKAKTENKLLLVDFTGSDWCPWCIKLHDEVFNKDEFKVEAPKKFVLVELDFPRKKSLPAPLKSQNDHLASQYKITGFPTLVLIGKNGRVLWRANFKDETLIPAIEAALRR